MADSLNEMKNNKFEYFLNAILYCLYLNEVWSNRKIDKIVNTIIPRAMKAKLNQQEKKRGGRLQIWQRGRVVYWCSQSSVWLVLFWLSRNYFFHFFRIYIKVY